MGSEPSLALKRPRAPGMEAGRSPFVAGAPSASRRPEQQRCAEPILSVFPLSFSAVHGPTQAECVFAPHTTGNARCARGTISFDVTGRATLCEIGINPRLRQRRRSRPSPGQPAAQVRRQPAETFHVLRQRSPHLPIRRSAHHQLLAGLSVPDRSLGQWPLTPPSAACDYAELMPTSRRRIPGSAPSFW